MSDQISGDRLVEHRELQIVAMHRMATAVFSRHTVDDLVREVLRAAADVLHSEVGSLQLFDPATNTLVFKHVLDPQDEVLVGRSMSVFQGIAGTVFRTGKGVVTLSAPEHAEWNPEIDEITGYRTCSMLTAPLKGRDSSPIGVIQILNGRRTYDSLDLEVLEVLSACAASAIETARLMEEARRAQLVGLVGDIAHDIKNLMTPVQTGTWVLQNIVSRGLADLRSANEHNWRQKIDVYVANAELNLQDTVRAMRSAGERIQERTGQLAGALKGEGNDPIFVSLDLNQPLRDVERALSLVALAAGVTLNCDFTEEMPLCRADPRQIYNAVYNLVINAVAATPAGGKVTLRSTMIPSSEAPGEFLIEVEDNGSGIPEQIQRHLFTDKVISTKPGGTGLGTRIVADVLRQHGGRVEFTSELGVGTKFILHIPEPAK